MMPEPLHDTASPSMNGAMIAMFAFCCGAIVGNLYYAQPIIGLIAPDIGLHPRAAGLIVSLTQIGYALGLFFLVPLCDLMENRRLMMVTTAVCIASLAAAAFARSAPVFLATALFIGISSVSVQMLIPLAANLAPEASRGRVVGAVMGGLLLGIMLARPLASAVAGHFGWRVVFGGAAVLMAGIEIVFALTMPRHRPAHRATYAALLRSLATLMRDLPVLRMRAFSQACMFASFALFWTAAPLELARRHGFSQTQIAVFALVGALGAIAAPISGRLADAGHTRVATLSAITVAALCYLPSLVDPALGVFGLVLTGVAIDFCVQMNMVLGQREIYALDATSRGRLNALYMTSIFIGGAIGAALASVLYEHGGWLWAALAGSTFACAALARFLIGPAAASPLRAAAVAS